MKAITEASKIVATSRNIPTPQKPIKTIYECIKDNAFAAVPMNVYKNAINAGKQKSPPKNQALSYLRQTMHTYNKSPRME